MVLVRRTALLVLGIGSALAVLLVGVYAYRQAVGLVGVDALTAKVAAENVLFAAIVPAIVIILGLSFLVVKSVRFSRELDRIVRSSRYHDASPEAALRRLGELGDKLVALYHQAHAVSESKSIKISALSELNAFLVVNLPTPILITTVDGTIVDASRSFQTKVDRNRSELIGASFRDLVPEPAWNEIETELLRSRLFVSRKTALGDMTFYPIENRTHETAYVVCSLEKAERMHVIERTREEGPTQGKGPTFRRRFGEVITGLLRPSH